MCAQVRRGFAPPLIVDRRIDHPGPVRQAGTNPFHVTAVHLPPWLQLRSLAVRLTIDDRDGIAVLTSAFDTKDVQSKCSPHRNPEQLIPARARTAMAAGIERCTVVTAYASPLQKRMLATE